MKINQKCLTNFIKCLKILLIKKLKNVIQILYIKMFYTKNLAKMIYFTKPLYFMCCTQFNSHSVWLHYKNKERIYKLVVKLFTLSRGDLVISKVSVFWSMSCCCERRHLSDAFSGFTGFHPLSLFLSHWKWIKWVTFSKQLPVPPPLTPAVICLQNRNRISGPSIKSIFTC